MIVMPECDSTNAVALRLPDAELTTHGWAVVAAEKQTAGRGRLGRTWASPPGAGVTFSVALGVPTHLPAAQLGLLPLLAGMAVAGVCRADGVTAWVKWPNDVVVPDPDDPADLAKLAGVLAERGATSAVVGVGLNVSLTAAEAPVPNATSLVRQGATSLDRDHLVAACAAAILGLWTRVVAGSAAAVMSEFRDICITIGADVEIHQPGGHRLRGQATAVDDHGHLEITSEEGRSTIVTAGDVIHVRPPEPPELPL